jgi:hypothetical protein
VAPLAAEVGQEFPDNLASKGRKNKAPAEGTGTSGASRVHKAPASDSASDKAPPAKRPKKAGVKRRREIPVASG